MGVSSRLVSAVLSLASANLSAQQGSYIRPEVRAFAGAFLPGASAGRYLGSIVGLESAVELTDFADGVVSVVSAQEHNTAGAVARHAATVWRYHAGIEFNSTQPHENNWIWSPFAGGGAGGRTYDYAQPGIPAATYPSSYGAVGLDVRGGATAYRVEARGYLSPFQAPLSGRRQVRADFAITAGIAYHF
jgi:hypothetical protein